ncbi:P22 phage major capsid protein family protein [Edaphobacter paludis]|uniref:P22 phage major capsid protein family protein n=1 Tax=Edaphobacter paludis TaxID=3035702 RepID=A0AAU7D795_9BACT
MANSLLSPTIITREALRILHSKLNFIGNCDKQYDDKFANSGASPSGKIGPSLTIRMPNQYTIRNGPTLSTQDVVESSQVLTVSTQKGVDFVFASQDLTLTIDDFSERYLKPAISVLATNVEADALNMVKDVYNAVDDNAATFSYKDFANGRRLLNQYLAPDDDRVGIINSGHVVSYLDAIKGLFNPQESVARPYLNAKIGKVNGIDTFENTVLAPFQSGTSAAATGYTATLTGGSSTVVMAVGANTFNQGDIVTFSTVFAIDPETKLSRGYLQQFVVTAAYAGGAGNMTVSPTPITAGAAQNVTNVGAGLTVAKVGGGASALYSQSLVFQKEAFAFVTADLVDVSKFGAWGARQVMDGISMRIARQYNITNDTVPCRIDLLYGYKTLRPQLAARIIAQ